MKVSFWREGFPTLPCLPPQMWGAACGGPHPLHWWHKHGVLYTRRSHPVPSQHHRPGEAGDSPAPSDPPGPEGTWPWWVELLHPSLFLALAAFFLQRVGKTHAPPLYHTTRLASFTLLDLQGPLYKHLSSLESPKQKEILRLKSEDQTIWPLCICLNFAVNWELGEENWFDFLVVTGNSDCL